MKFIALTALILTAPLMAEENPASLTDSISNIENTTYRGYYKRDRYFIFGSQVSALSQMHEIDGWRLGLGGLNRADTTTIDGEDLQFDGNAYVADVSYGFDNVALGLIGSRSFGEMQATDINTKENITLSYLMPKLAVFLNPNWTLAAGVEVAELEINSAFGNLDSATNYNLSRASLGFSYHTSKLEAGISYQSEYKDGAPNRGDSIGALSLAPMPQNKRAVYAPAMVKTNLRGNVSDSVSLSSTLGYSFYDSKADGTVALFDDYDNEDLLAGKIEATYWFIGRSRLSAAAEYQGGATARDGVEELGLSNRIANLYGGSVSGVYSFNKAAYLSLVGRLMRGELNEANNEIEYKSKEELRTIALSVGAKL